MSDYRKALEAIAALEGSDAYRAAFARLIALDALERGDTDDHLGDQTLEPVSWL